MSKTFLFFLSLISWVSFAQGTRIMYEYNFVPNLEKKDSIYKELMCLDIKIDGSNFYSRQKFYSDSLQMDLLQKDIDNGTNDFNLDNVITSKVAISVTKKYPNYTTILHDNIGENNYSIKSKSLMNWKILSDKKRISKFDAQKATIDFGGRSWTAWFATEIPFQDGPYKFHGLPGLILEMEDTTGTQKFKFVGNQKLNEAVKGKSSNTDEFFKSKEIEITEDKFRKLWKEYRKDPAKEMRRMLSGGNPDMIMIDDNGKELNSAEMIRRAEKIQNSKIKENSNKIEPTLYP